MLKKKYQGFTLVEVLVVVAMIAILSSAILVAVSGQREQARRSKVLVEVSGVIQPMMMCWSDGGTVNSSGNVCSLGAGYGTWPDLAASGWSLTASNFTDSGNWFFQVSDGSNYICCNSTYDRCADMGTSNVCNTTTVLN
jgi:prepilin-type N-terminal cleavage/methylation domain-containing protein